MAMAAHPTFLLAGDTDDEGIIGNVLGNDGSGGDEAVAAQGYSADDGGVGTDGGAAANQGLFIKRMAKDLGTRIGDIGQDAGRTEENIIFNFRTGINRYVVLNFYIISNANVVCNIHILSKDTTFPNTAPD